MRDLLEHEKKTCAKEKLMKSGRHAQLRKNDENALTGTLLAPKALILTSSDVHRLNAQICESLIKHASDKWMHGFWKLQN